MNTHNSILYKITYIYIYLPILIFLFGWTRLPIALITSVILTVGVFKMVNDISNDDTIVRTSISIPILLLSLLIIICICIWAGIGGVYPQAGDWYKHNAVLRDLIVYKWPVYYQNEDKAMLTYYLGHYLFPALLGKMTGSFEVGNITMFIWTVLGLYITYVHLVRVVKADKWYKQLLALLFMLFFCGALNSCQNILKEIYADEMNSLGSQHWILVNNYMLQYRSNFVMIRWVAPQIIVPWITVLLFSEHYSKVKYYVLLLLPSILYGTFSFGAFVVIGFIFTICLMLKHDITIKDVFSNLNILPLLSFGLISFFYFLGNMQVDKPVSSSFRFVRYDGLYIGIYIVFCVCMFGIYAACVFKENKKNILWYINIFVLLFLPWCRMGLCNDIVMSASIPSLFFLMIWVLQLLFDERQLNTVGIRKGIVLVIFIIGLWYPFLELWGNIRANTQGFDMGDDYKTMCGFTDRDDSTVAEDLKYNYYTYELDGKIFYEYIARKKI